MNWFNFFDTKTTIQKHPFGRGINATLAPDEEELFTKSDEAFAKKDTLQAYEYFFKSLENFNGETSNENISYSRDGNTLHFSIYQGCAKITGKVTKEHLYAESIITKSASASVALKRHILDRNYQLTYANYFSDSEFIKLKLYHDNITMTPQKTFFPLREIALNADFDKEYIKNEFENIHLEEISHLTNLPDNETRIKYNFMQSTITEVIHKIDSLPSNDNTGMQAFALLNTFYMLDYLLVPKYGIYQKISKKLQEYFAQDNASLESKNNELLAYLSKLQEMDYEEFVSNFYNAKYTFNQSEKTPQEDIDNFISESLLKIRWYKNNRYNQIIPTIYKYISFYILYNYGVNPVVKELLHTLVEIQNPEFFASLEYPKLYNEQTQIFSKKLIITTIEDIIEPHQSRYKLLEDFGEELNYSTLNEFSNSFYLQIQNLNFEEI